jgi:hypothetical protein
MIETRWQFLFFGILHFVEQESLIFYFTEISCIGREMNRPDNVIVPYMIIVRYRPYRDQTKFPSLVEDIQ